MGWKTNARELESAVFVLFYQEVIGSVSKNQFKLKRASSDRTQVLSTIPVLNFF